MGLFYVRGSVACVLLMVALSTANDKDCVVQSLESRLDKLEGQLTVIQNQLTAMQGFMMQCYGFLIKEGCRIDMASYGYDDQTKLGYVRTSGGSSVNLYVPGRPAQHRGVILFVLDTAKCTVDNGTQFDTWNSADDRQRLLQVLQSIPKFQVIVGVTADSPENNFQLQNAVGSFFTQYHMDLTGLQMRDKFAFVIQKGYPSKTVFERKAHDQDILTMSVEIRGSTVDDMTLNKV